jgi:hypothetical protein
MEKAGRNGGYVIDGREKRGFVCFGWLVKAADLSHELKRSGSNLVGGNRGIEVKESLDIPAHSVSPQPDIHKISELMKAWNPVK